MNTITAIATAKGSAGIGVIRISGEKAKLIADKVFKPVSGCSLLDVPGYNARFGKIVDGSDEIDEGIALVFNSPNSYTGEDVVEISCHGGMYITKRTLRAILNAGASLAEPGEFTKRAFLNGKISLTQAESVMDIISAKGKQSARSALSNMEGALYKKIRSINDQLINMASHLSAWADYPEEDIPLVERDNILDILNNSSDELKFLLSNYDAGLAIKEGIDTVIVGKPNVGKSTLMNLISGYEKSIVTDIPGTTRDIVEETVFLGDIMLNLSDTAGLRNTLDPVESIGVNKAKNKLKTSRIILAMFDASKPLTDEDQSLLEDIKDLPCIAIINKTDLDNNLNCDYIKKFINRVVFISAKMGRGVDILSREISELIGVNKIDVNDAIIANERQYVAAKKSLSFINEAIDSLKLGITLDAITVLIESSIQELLELTGEKVSDAVIDKVFSQFCVGK